jgi:hypothetical protein
MDRVVRPCRLNHFATYKDLTVFVSPLTRISKLLFRLSLKFHNFCFATLQDFTVFSGLKRASNEDQAKGFGMCWC